ncbi:SusC/RagA family TonB-linked outer membrane protein [Pedobacter agri]|uniref:SusC/RagA family TonB-linked outer membrane protein n=1 Tax=Pedobacter agri TaxID=454586 RepID=UPI0027860551|nr:TonB-dependent receptor [Pedobacter agri]MDQ1142873.1 TonB-linked SusC/RagA family outer membrane protein [Pedobacter agri]
MKKITYLCCIFMMLLSIAAYAQRKQITGVVSDQSGLLPGATVVEKSNPSNGTTTNQDGKFTLSVSSNTLVIRLIGYATREINIDGQTNITISLNEDKTDLDDVVVVGYGTQKKKTLTGAVASIGGDEIRQSPSPSLQNSLAGRITGFSSQQISGQPGADGARFYIRGVSSYVSGASNNPLILVDDIEFTYDQFSQLSANEVESVSILKDAATTSIYGIKGANGVILVTTTRGKVGKPRISLLVEYGLSQLTRTPKALGSYEAASLINEAQVNTNNLNPNPSFVRTFSDNDLELYRTGADPYGHPNNDWSDILLKRFAPQAKANFNVNGGTEKAKYFVSIGYLNQGGQLKDFSEDLNSKFYYKRYNYRSNIDLKVTKTLDVKFDLFGNVDETNANNATANNTIFSDLGRLGETAPFNYPVYNPNGTLGYSVWQRTASGRNNNNIVGRLMYNGYYRTFNNNINLSTSANQKLDFITSGLSIKGVLAYRNLYFYSRSLSRPVTGTGFISYVYDPVTDSYSFGQRDNIFRISTPGLSYSSGSTASALTMQAMLNYGRSFGNHNVSGLILYNTNDKRAQNTTNSNLYNFIPEVFSGITARFGYDYRQKYLIELSGAYNGSDRFAQGKKKGFFPAASVGWNIAEETFVKDNLHFIDQFKLRGSYGVVGADNTGGVYAYLQNWATGSGSGLFGLATNNGYGTVTEGTLANNEVTWEKDKKLDIGLDMAFFKNKLSAKLDYFNNNRYDIITNRGTISAVFGQNLPLVNIGKTNNRGFEAEISFRDEISKDWNYFIQGTYSLAKNKITFRDEAETLYPYQRETGQAIGSVLKYKWTGEFYTLEDIANPAVPKPTIGGRPGDIKYMDLNGDGVIDANDRSFFGSTNLPTTIAGITLGVGYKNFRLSVLFQAALDFVASAQGAVIHHNASNQLPIHQQHWTPALGNNAKYPQLYTTALSQSPRDFYSDFWAIPGDYVRLKTAELSYSAGPKLLSKLGVKGLRLYTNGYNLLTFTKLDRLYNLDPEVLESAGDLPYPPTRIINMGLNVTF